MLKVRMLTHTEITVMHLIDGATFKHPVGRFVLLPSHRVSVFQVNHSRALPVHAHRSCIDTWSFSAPLTINFHFKGVKLSFEITLHRLRPRSICTFF